MQIIKIDNSSGSELYAGDFILGVRVPAWSHGPMTRKCFARASGAICQMISVIAKCAKLIPIVLRRDCQDGDSDFLELLARWHHRVVVCIECGMFEDALKID